MALEFLTLSTHPASHELLHGILKQVSRSFYLTLNVLPDGVRDQMGLSYLFARAADTASRVRASYCARKRLYVVPLDVFRSGGAPVAPGGSVRAF